MFQIRQRLINLVVTVTFRNQALQLDPPQLRHLKNLFDIVGLPARYARNGNFTRDEVPAAYRKRSAAQAADDCRRAARPGRLNDLVGGLGITDRFERFIDPTLGELHYRLYRILGSGVDCVRRAKALRRVQFLIGNVDSDDRISSEAF